MNFSGKFSETATRGIDARLCLAVLIIALALVSFSVGCKGKASPLAAPSSNAPVADAPPNNSYADVVVRVAPAVVTIRADKRVRAPQQFPFMDDPFFRGLFGNRMPQQPQEQLERALGSGVIVS